MSLQIHSLHSNIFGDNYSNNSPEINDLRNTVLRNGEESYVIDYM
jgi:hypothetical protein